MIYITSDILKQIIEHCKKELPNEACGILAGNGFKVVKAYEMENTDKSPSSFLMDPKEQIKVFKHIRSSALEMLGIYHSHVCSHAYPSERDVNMAFYPEVSYVIISLADVDNPIVRSFRIKEGKITEEELRIK